MDFSRSWEDGIHCGEGASTAEEDPEELDLTACSAAAHSKRVRQAENERPFRGTKLDAVIWSALDDHLQEKVIARLPFKFLFQAASLSKTWRLRFHYPSFQSEVHSSTASWKSYAPLFVNHKKDLVGYESTSKRWHTLPNHSYLNQDFVRDWCLRAGDGSLLCWTCATPFSYAHANELHLSHTNRVHVIVSNPLTRSWRQLPPREDMLFPELVHVVWEGSWGYKVILGSLKTPPITQRGRVCLSMQIFDCATGTWTLESYYIEGRLHNTEWGGSAIINGVLYVLVSTLETRPEYHLISLDLKEKVWKEIPHLYQVIDEDRHKPHQLMKFNDIRFSQVFVCGSNVMLVIFHRDKVSSMDFEFDDSSDDEESTRETLSVFRLDLEQGLAFEVSRAPSEMLSVAGICSAAGHGDCIYFGGRFPSGSSIMYSVGTRQWHWVSSATASLLSFSDTRMIQWLWTSVTYQPGLNPFLEL